MNTDTVQALLHEQNPRSHPLLAGLLYAFCPTAARWWTEGANPEPAFDLVWRVLEDRTGFETLKSALEDYGLESLLDEVRRYYDQVQLYRTQHFGVPAPERLPLFRGGTLPLDRRFNHTAAIRNLGGTWANLFEYVRLWAFVYPDWLEAMHLGEDTGFSLEFLQIPGGAFDVHYPVWCAREGSRQVIAILGPCGSTPDPLRFLLIQRAIDALEHPAELWALNPKTGEAQPFEGVVAADVLDTLVDGLALVAAKGPHPAPERSAAP